MKILHVITRLIVGGAQENTLLTCEGLVRRGHEVILLTGPSPGPEGTLMRRAEGGGYRVIVTPHLVRRPDVWHDWRAYREIGRWVRELRPEVVHTHSSKAGILGRGAAWGEKTRNAKRETRNEIRDEPRRHEGVKGHEEYRDIGKNRPLVVHTVHGLPFHPYQSGVVNRVWVGMERWAGRRCDAIVCVADAMTRQALAAGVGKKELFTTIYSGMKTEAFLRPGVTREEVRGRLGIPATAFVYGTIARLQPLKGHDDLLSAAGELFAGVLDAHLVWVGDGAFRERFERELQAKGWRDRVTLTGLVAPAEVPRLMAAMDVVVHPSYREGLARALPQALLAGVPVISYDCDGAREVCIEGETGFLVRTGDALALAAAMVRMAEGRAAAKEMGARGRTLCEERFSAERMVEQIEALYVRLAGANAR